MHYAFAKYRTSRVAKEYRLRFFYDGKLVGWITVREGQNGYYPGEWIDGLAGWSRRPDGDIDPDALKRVYENRDLYAGIDNSPKAEKLTAGKIKYVLGKLPTRNLIRTVQTTVNPSDVVRINGIPQFIYEDPDISGHEWANPAPAVMERPARREYSRLAPMRRRVEPGKVIIQFLDLPQRPIEMLIKIQDYINPNDTVKAEETDMTKEEMVDVLHKIYDGRMPNFVEIVTSQHDILPDQWSGNRYPVESLGDLTDVDSIEWDNADEPGTAEQEAWAAMDPGWTIENGTAYLVANKHVPTIPLKMNCRITKTMEVL